MTARREGTDPTLIAGVRLSFGIGVLLFAGCAGDRPRPADRPEGLATSQTEAELLAQLDRKFEDPDAHYELGQLYQDSQQWSKAEYHYNIALGFEPAHRPSQAAMVKMLIQQGDAARAANRADSYMRGATSVPAELLKLGREFGKQGLDDYSLKCFQRGYDAAPFSHEANRDLGFYYLAHGDEAKAKRFLSTSFELNPRQADVALALGRLGVVVEAPRELGKDT